MVDVRSSWRSAQSGRSDPLPSQPAASRAWRRAASSRRRIATPRSPRPTSPRRARAGPGHPLVHGRPGPVRRHRQRPLRRPGGPGPGGDGGHAERHAHRRRGRHVGRARVRLRGSGRGALRAAGDAVVVWQDELPDRPIPRGPITFVTGVLDERTRTMQVEVDLPNEGWKLLPGTFVHVDIDVREPPAPLVPDDAILVRDGKTEVALVAGGRAHFVDVDLGVQRRLEGPRAAWAAGRPDGRHQRPARGARGRTRPRRGGGQGRGRFGRRAPRARWMGGRWMRGRDATSGLRGGPFARRSMGRVASRPRCDDLPRGSRGPTQSGDTSNPSTMSSFRGRARAISLAVASSMLLASARSSVHTGL